MNIDEMKLGDLKAIAAMFGGQSSATTPHIGLFCVVRCYASGIHAGTVISQSGRQVELKDSRRLWRFDARDHGISLSEVANHGGTSGRHKYCETLADLTLLDAIEIIPCSAEAKAAIISAPVAKAS